MVDRATLLALADRVKRLTEPCEEADLEIARFQNVVCLRRNAEDTANEEFTHWRYTASLDAAATLVPEWCLFTTRTVWDKMKLAGLGFVSRYEKGEFGGHERLYWMDEHQAVAATPALALCAAALRARAEATHD